MPHLTLEGQLALHPVLKVGRSGLQIFEALTFFV
jgi:hypothetical protein